MSKCKELNPPLQEQLVFPATDEKLFEINKLHKVEIPGIIDEDTIQHIYDTMWEDTGRADYDRFYLPEDFEWVWKTTRGTLPKRIASSVYKTDNIKLSTKTISAIGNIASHYASGNTVYYFTLWPVEACSIWPEGRYGDDGSCFFGCREDVINLFEEKGFMAMKLYRGDTGRTYEQLMELFESNIYRFEGHSTYSSLCLGRCWVKEEYIDQIGTKGLIFFNGYMNTGNNGAVDFARIFSHYKNSMPYKKIKLYNNSCIDGLIYINSGGYLVAPVAYTELNKVVGHDFYIDESAYGYGNYCVFCDENYTGDTYYAIANNGEEVQMCRGCYESLTCQCERCENQYFTDGYNAVSMTEVGDQEWCPGCIDNHSVYLEKEDIYLPDDDLDVVEIDDEYYTIQYAEKYFKQCPHCKEWITE